MENTNFETRNIYCYADYKSTNGLTLELKEYTNAAGEVKYFAVDNKNNTYYISDKAIAAIQCGNFELLMYCECSKDGSVFVPTIYTKSVAQQAKTIATF